MAFCRKAPARHGNRRRAPFSAASPWAIRLLLAGLLFASAGGAQEARKSNPDSGNVLELERLRPEIVYAERRGPNLRLNFDVEIANGSDQPVDLTYLELRAYGTNNRFLTRAQLGSNGLPGPLADLPSRTVPPQGTLYLFNPFRDLPVADDVGRIEIRIFHSAGRLDLDLRPQPVPGPVMERMPVAGRAYVFSGSDAHSHHRRVSLNSAPAVALDMQHLTQRFALDFTVVDADTGDLAAPGAASRSQWHGYGARIVAPLDGRVITARGVMADSTIDADGNVTRPADYERFGPDASLGNFVVLDVGGSYLTLAHFREGTLALRPGDSVKAGQPIGEIGLSGDTAYPHLHMQLQDSPDPLTARPLPVVFACARIGVDENARRWTQVGVDTGMTVRDCADD